LPRAWLQGSARRIGSQLEFGGAGVPAGPYQLAEQAGGDAGPTFTGNASNFMLLAIETSGKSLGIALRAEAGLLFEENVTAGAIHGRALAPLIDKALAAQCIRPKDLHAIAVSIGPGSWTGLRIGISAAKTLAWALAQSGGAPTLIGVPSFEALALDAAAHAPGHARLTLRDARSEGLFVALFDETSAAPQRLLPETVLQSPQLLEHLDAAMSGRTDVPLAICGDRVCLEALDETAKAKAKGWNVLYACEHISAAAVAECAWRRFKNGDGVRTVAEIHKLSPLYLRASDPELKLKQRP